MENIQSLTVFEEDTEGFGGFEVIRRTNPERILRKFSPHLPTEFLNVLSNFYVSKRIISASVLFR